MFSPSTATSRKKGDFYALCGLIFLSEKGEGRKRGKNGILGVGISL